MQRVLLIEDNPVQTLLLKADFQRSASAEFDLLAVQRLSEALEILKHGSIDVILLDLFLDDTAGLETLVRVRDAGPDVPIVVLTSHNDEVLALEALKKGAQDYLIKGTVHTHVLFRAIRYAIERKHAEFDRRVLEQKLVQNQKLEAVGTLAAGAAHNFNNLLTVMLGHCQMLLEDMPSGDSNRKHLEPIATSGEKAATLIHQLLTFSQKETAELQVVSLNEVILGLNMLLESTLSGVAELELKLKADCDLIEGSPSQLRQMLMNLVLNARNAMTEGGILALETSNSRGGEILLTISDTGCGMSPETCARVFEPFFTTKSLAEASGLGLFTVYGIVRQHGGTIAISSKLGEGTVVSVVFPTLGVSAVETKRSATASHVTS